MKILIIVLTMKLPNELIAEIYEHSESKFQLIEIFPWLTGLVPKCSCGKQSNFVVKFSYDDTCYSCYENKNISDDKYLCKLKCKNLYYDIEFGEYVIEPSYANNYKLKAELLCEKADCYYCGRRIMYYVTANGYQIQNLPKSKFQKNAESFIKDHIIIDKNSEIKKSKIVYLFKQIFYNDKILNKEENKSINRKINDGFRKLLKGRAEYYIGCRLKN